MPVDLATTFQPASHDLVEPLMPYLFCPRYSLQREPGSAHALCYGNNDRHKFSRMMSKGITLSLPITIDSMPDAHAIESLS
jgi:hypothetical protein